MSKRQLINRKSGYGGPPQPVRVVPRLTKRERNELRRSQFRDQPGTAHHGPLDLVSLNLAAMFQASAKRHKVPDRASEQRQNSRSHSLAEVGATPASENFSQKKDRSMLKEKLGNTLILAGLAVTGGYVFTQGLQADNPLTGYASDFWRSLEDKSLLGVPMSWIFLGLIGLGLVRQVFPEFVSSAVSHVIAALIVVPAYALRIVAGAGQAVCAGVEGTGAFLGWLGSLLVDSPTARFSLTQSPMTDGFLAAPMREAQINLENRWNEHASRKRETVMGEAVARRSVQSYLGLGMTAFAAIALMWIGYHFGTGKTVPEAWAQLRSGSVATAKADATGEKKADEASSIQAAPADQPAAPVDTKTVAPVQAGQATASGDAVSVTTAGPSTPKS